MEIVRADFDDVKLIHELAGSIWWDAYKGILEDEQISFMLEQMYTEDSLRKQMESGAVFILAKDGDGRPVGFSSYENLADQKVLRIHKLYILGNQRGKGIGKQILNYISQEANKTGALELELNVNRNNPAYHFYLKQDFRVKEEVDIPYFQYVLNDYVMRKTV